MKTRTDADLESPRAGRRWQAYGWGLLALGIALLALDLARGLWLVAPVNLPMLLAAGLIIRNGRRSVRQAAEHKKVMDGYRSREAQRGQARWS